MPGRTSSFYFKGKNTKIASIARDPGVGDILKGSERRSCLRVGAQLTRAVSGYNIRAETHDRDAKDTFKVQNRSQAPW